MANRLIELFGEGGRHLKEVYNTLDKGSTGKNLRHDKAAILSSFTNSFPALAKNPKDANLNDLLAFGGIGTLSTKIPKLAKENIERHAIAQRNAALPVEQGGLGLHPENTAMDRAKALGYTHMLTVRNPDRLFNQGEILQQDLKGMSAKSKKDIKPILDYLSENDIPHIFNRAGKTKSGYLIVEGNPMLNSRSSYPPYLSEDIEMRFSDHPTNMPESRYKTNFQPEINDDYLSDIFPGGHESESALEKLKNTKGIRSRKAAFDPMQKNSSNILAGTALGAVLLNNNRRDK